MAENAYDNLLEKYKSSVFQTYADKICKAFSNFDFNLTFREKKHTGLCNCLEI